MGQLGASGPFSRGPLLLVDANPGLGARRQSPTVRGPCRAKGGKMAATACPEDLLDFFY